MFPNAARCRNIHGALALLNVRARSAAFSSIAGPGMNVESAPLAPAPDNSLAVRIGALAVLAVGMATVSAFDAGPLAAHMIAHIAVMNVAAPLVAIALRRPYPPVSEVLCPAKSGALWAVTIAQLLLLWTLHIPAVHHAAYASAVLLAALHVSLFFVALVFWLSIVNAGACCWQAILALILSGKFACLLGVLLIFAPRPLFGSHGPHGMQAELLADQQMAGLLMVAACPLSYVLVAVIVAAHVIIRLETSGSLADSGTRQRRLA